MVEPTYVYLSNVDSVMVDMSAYTDTISVMFSYPGRLFSEIYYDERALDIVVNDFIKKGDTKEFYPGLQGTKVNADTLTTFSPEAYGTANVRLTPDPLQVDFVKLDDAATDTTYILFFDSLPIQAYPISPPEPPEPKPIPTIILDVDSLDVFPGQDFSVPIFGTAFQDIDNLAVYFEYDAEQVVYEGFGGPSNGRDITTAFPEKGSVTILMTLTKEPLFVDGSLIGTTHFRTTDAFSGTGIRLVQMKVDGEALPVNLEIELTKVEPPPLPGDFNEDGIVNVADFLLFVHVFGVRVGQEGYDEKYDMDGDGEVGIPDFLLFVEAFGE